MSLLVVKQNMVLAEYINDSIDTLEGGDSDFPWDECSMIFPGGAESFLRVMATDMVMVMAMDMVTDTVMAMGAMVNMDVMENIIHTIEGKEGQS